MAKKSPKESDAELDQDEDQRRDGERRTRRDIAYEYEITLDPKPERRKGKQRRNDKK